MKMRVEKRNGKKVYICEYSEEEFVKELAIMERLKIVVERDLQAQMKAPQPSASIAS